MVSPYHFHLRPRLQQHAFIGPSGEVSLSLGSEISSQTPTPTDAGSETHSPSPLLLSVTQQPSDSPSPSSSSAAASATPSASEPLVLSLSTLSGFSATPASSSGNPSPSISVTTSSDSASTSQLSTSSTTTEESQTASTASTTTAASSTSVSSSSISSSSNVSTDAVTSIVAVASESVTPSASASAVSGSLNHSAPIIAFAVVGGAAAIACLCAGIAFWFRHRRIKRDRLDSSLNLPWAREESEIGLGIPVQHATFDNRPPENQNPFDDNSSSMRQSIAFPEPVHYTYQHGHGLASNASASALEGDSTMGYDTTFGPLMVANLSTGDRSLASSRASTALGMHPNIDPESGTPIQNIDRPRFLTLEGQGLSVPWRRSDSQRRPQGEQWDRLPSPSIPPEQTDPTQQQSEPATWSESLRSSFRRALNVAFSPTETDVEDNLTPAPTRKVQIHQSSYASDQSMHPSGGSETRNATGAKVTMSSSTYPGDDAGSATGSYIYASGFENLDNVRVIDSSPGLSRAETRSTTGRSIVTTESQAPLLKLPALDQGHSLSRSSTLASISEHFPVSRSGTITTLASGHNMKRRVSRKPSNASSLNELEQAAKRALIDRRMRTKNAMKKAAQASS